jgi:hypothetical protein
MRCSSWLDNFKDFGNTPEDGDSLNCAQIVALGKTGFWTAAECNDLKVELAPQKCCGTAVATPNGKWGDWWCHCCAHTLRHYFLIAADLSVSNEINSHGGNAGRNDAPLMETYWMLQALTRCPEWSKPNILHPKWKLWQLFV